jgi:hypothetical protein
MLPQFNDYLVFADEAGDHLMLPHYKDFPLFVLAFCLVNRVHYADFIVPQMLRLKLKYFQDPHIILHERDIRKGDGDFLFLSNEKIRKEFCSDLNTFMIEAQFTIIATVIRKNYLQHNTDSPSLYDVGTSSAISRILKFFNQHNQTLPATLAFEARGKKEDDELKVSFLNIIQEQKCADRLHLKILPKISNCCGLQLADLVARPIGRHVLNPAQPNRAYEIIQDKIFCGTEGVEGYGIKILP